MSRSYDIDHEAEHAKRVLPTLVEALENALEYIEGFGDGEGHTGKKVIAAIKAAKDPSA